MSTRGVRVEREVTDEERTLLRAMATDAAIDDRTKKKALAVLTFLETKDLSAASERSNLSIRTISKTIHLFDEDGWRSLITIQSPRGGDFLSHYDQGFWAERLVRVYLNKSRDYRAIPYGTSRSEPFTDLQTFRDHAVNEFLLQAWSSGRRWKRPDLLLVARQMLQQEAGNDSWTPDLIHWDNKQCAPFVARAAAAIEVETSLWEVTRSRVPLSFTVKEEDLEGLCSWASANDVPLYICQVFYDEAHVLAFSRLEFLIGSDAPPDKRVTAEVDRTTRKATYKIPLTEGVRLGHIPEPNVEGRVYKAPNGKVTVYGRLTGSFIEAQDRNTLELLASGRLEGKNE
ncbi:MAG: AccI family restriction endonuclease [Bacillota bacterium]